jgi:molecular chaperone GrpE
MQDQENQEVSQAPEAETVQVSGVAAEPTLEEQLSATEAKLAEMHDAFMRAKAEGENIRRRAQEDVSKAHKFAIESFAEAMVPVRDSLEMALKVETPSIESLKEGVEMTLKQLTSAFEKNRLVEDHAGAGRQARPDEAPGRGRGAGRAGSQHRRRVLQKGYMIADRLLRPAIVTAAQAK